MSDLNDFFAKKLTMKEIDSYLNDNKMNFNNTENLMASNKPLTSKSGADLSKEDEEEEYGSDEDYGAEDIIKELLKQGYFNDVGKNNDAISEKSDEQDEEENQEEPEDKSLESSVDSIVVKNRE